MKKEKKYEAAFAVFLGASVASITSSFSAEKEATQAEEAAQVIEQAALTIDSRGDLYHADDFQVYASNLEVEAAHARNESTLYGVLGGVGIGLTIATGFAVNTCRREEVPAYSQSFCEEN